jgi:hypothetical protein
MTTIDIGLPVSIARLLIQRIEKIAPHSTIHTIMVREEEQEPHSPQSQRDSRPGNHSPDLNPAKQEPDG